MKQKITSKEWLNKEFKKIDEDNKKRVNKMFWFYKITTMLMVIMFGWVNINFALLFLGIMIYLNLVDKDKRELLK